MCLFPAGLPCPRVQFFILRRQLPRDTQAPAWFRARSFSETTVCYGSKDGITKDGGGDGGKVLFFVLLSILQLVSGEGKPSGRERTSCRTRSTAFTFKTISSITTL